MSAYIEYVILDNFVVTYMLAALTYRILLKRVLKLRVVAAATVGTGCRRLLSVCRERRLGGDYKAFALACA